MPRNDRLYDLMEQLDQADLIFLLKYGLGKTGRTYRQCTRDELKHLISSELRRAASHNFAHFFRFEHEFPYKQILIDVADNLSGYKSERYKLNDHHTEEEIEKEILRLFESKTQAWWKRLKNEEKKRVADEISRLINAEMVNSVNKRTYIKHRITKEVMDSVITKGIVVGMLAVSAGGMLGIIGGSVLTQIGFKIVAGTMGLMSGIKILATGIGGFSGKAVLDIIGGTVAGLAIFVPSTIYFYADADYKKTMPTIIMLLSKVHLNKTFSHKI